MGREDTDIDDTGRDTGGELNYILLLPFPGIFSVCVCTGLTLIIPSVTSVKLGGQNDDDAHHAGG